jgi:hypothetical protein
LEIRTKVVEKRLVDVVESQSNVIASSHRDRLGDFPLADARLEVEVHDRTFLEHKMGRKEGQSGGCKAKREVQRDEKRGTDDEVVDLVTSRTA